MAVIYYKDGSNWVEIGSNYPVGAVYMSTEDTSPGSLFGGTWEKIEEKYLLAGGGTHTSTKDSTDSASFKINCISFDGQESMAVISNNVATNSLETVLSDSDSMSVDTSAPYEIKPSKIISTISSIKIKTSPGPTAQSAQDSNTLEYIEGMSIYDEAMTDSSAFSLSVPKIKGAPADMVLTSSNSIKKLFTTDKKLYEPVNRELLQFNEVFNPGDSVYGGISFADKTDSRGKAPSTINTLSASITPQRRVIELDASNFYPNYFVVNIWYRTA